MLDPPPAGRRTVGGMTTHTEIQPTQLPATIRGYLAAHAARDVDDAAAVTFTPTAVVVDEDETFRGTHRVRDFLGASGAQFTYTTELVGAERVDDAHWIARTAWWATSPAASSSSATASPSPTTSSPSCHRPGAMPHTDPQHPSRGVDPAARPSLPERNPMSDTPAQDAGAPTMPTIVLVHGAFADSSSWNDVIASLRSDGHPVIAAANPLRGLRPTMSYLRTVLDGVTGPIVVAGHSYGGTVMSEAAAGNPGCARSSTSPASSSTRARAPASWPRSSPAASWGPP